MGKININEIIKEYRYQVSLGQNILDVLFDQNGKSSLQDKTKATLMLNRLTQLEEEMRDYFKDFYISYSVFENQSSQWTYLNSIEDKKKSFYRFKNFLTFPSAKFSVTFRNLFILELIEKKDSFKANLDKIEAITTLKSNFCDFLVDSDFPDIFSKNYHKSCLIIKKDEISPLEFLDKSFDLIKLQIKKLCNESSFICGDKNKEWFSLSSFTDFCDEWYSRTNALHVDYGDYFSNKSNERLTIHNTLSTPVDLLIKSINTDSIKDYLDRTLSSNSNIQQNIIKI